MVVVVQLGERQIVALEVKGSIPFDHPIFIFGGVSPSGKALDSDSNTRRFESYHPSHAYHKSACLVRGRIWENLGFPVKLRFTEPTVP